MVVKSIEHRISLFFSLITFILLFIITALYTFQTREGLRSAFEDNARNLLNSIYNQVINQHESIEFHREKFLEFRKKEIKNNTYMAIEIVESYYDGYHRGDYSENDAKERALEGLKRIRYSNGVGYYWINDTGRPYPSMIMHPTIPELDNQVLDSPEFNCALGVGENLFKAFVDVSMEFGEGYVDYLWPKPTPQGLSENQPKISFVKLFEPWNWIVGTGLYIDDIEAERENRLKKVLEELNSTIPQLTVGENGYFYIFNSKSDILVHPNLRGENIRDEINRETGNPLTQELMWAADSDSGSLEYIWDKPGFEGIYEFKKKSFVKKYEPLDWYISASIYLDDFHKMVLPYYYIMIITGLFSLLLIIYLAIIISKKITSPLNKLINAITEIDQDGIPLHNIPHLETMEFNLLEQSVNRMLTTIKRSNKKLRSQEEEIRGKNRELLEHKDNLESLVKIRTYELESSIERLKITQDKLIESEKLASLGGLVAGVAHEMNTPVGIGVTAASYLEERTQLFKEFYKDGHISKSDFEKYLNLCIESSEIILSNLNRVSVLINNFKRLADGQKREERELINLKELLTNVVLTYKERVISCGHEILLEAENEDLELISNPDTLYQILDILIDNSLIHGFTKGDNGLITIKLYREGKSAIIEFMDNGKGIKAKNIKNIFNPFYTTNRSRGTGLGLNIAYNLVYSRLKGEISCNSVEGSNTVILIRIPITQQ